jgi:hypothetical protein
MANPNILNVTSIYGNTAYVTPSSTAVNTSWTYNGATALTGLTPTAGSVNKINSIVVTNTTGSAANATVAIANNATFGSGTAYPLASTIPIPANSTLIVVDKSNGIYVTESQSIGVTSGTSNALTFVASFEVIT